jgi:hypothetical protein
MGGRPRKARPAATGRRPWPGRRDLQRELPRQRLRPTPNPRSTRVERCRFGEWGRLTFSWQHPAGAPWRPPSTGFRPRRPRPRAARSPPRSSLTSSDQAAPSQDPGVLRRALSYLLVGFFVSGASSCFFFSAAASRRLTMPLSCFAACAWTAIRGASGDGPFDLQVGMGRCRQRGPARVSHAWGVVRGCRRLCPAMGADPSGEASREIARGVRRRLGMSRGMFREGSGKAGGRVGRDRGRSAERLGEIAGTVGRWVARGWRRGRGVSRDVGRTPGGWVREGRGRSLERLVEILKIDLDIDFFKLKLNIHQV